MSLDSRIYNEARRLGMPDNIARLIVAQAKHESAYKGVPYNSPVFKKNNNLNGYGWRGQAGASQGSVKPKNEWNKGQPTYYAKYPNIEGSVAEIVAYIKRRQSRNEFPKELTAIDTPYKYAALLKKAGYYGDTLVNYANGLTRWLRTIDIKKSLAVLPIVLAVGLFVLLQDK